MIQSKLKELDTRDKARISESKRDDERRKELQNLIKDYKLSSNSIKSSNNNIVTDICNIPK